MDSTAALHPHPRAEAIRPTRIGLFRADRVYAKVASARVAAHVEVRHKLRGFGRALLAVTTIGNSDFGFRLHPERRRGFRSLLGGLSGHWLLNLADCSNSWLRHADDRVVDELGELVPHLGTHLVIGFANEPLGGREAARSARSRCQRWRLRSLFAASEGLSARPLKPSKFNGFLPLYFDSVYQSRVPMSTLWEPMESRARSDHGRVRAEISTHTAACRGSTGDAPVLV